AGPPASGRSRAPRSTAHLRASAGRRQIRETGMAPCFFSGSTVTGLPHRIPRAPACGRDTEVDERGTPIGAATGRGLLPAPPPTKPPFRVAALPEVRCTPGFSGLARTSVKRLTFKSRAPGLFDALSSHAQASGAGVGKERGAHELVHVAGEVGEVYVGNAREVAGDLGEEFAGEQAERGAFERTVIDVTVAAGRDVREQPDSHRGRQVKIPAEVARDIRPLDSGTAGGERIHQRAYAGEDCRLGADEARQVALPEGHPLVGGERNGGAPPAFHTA